MSFLYEEAQYAGQHGVEYVFETRHHENRQDRLEKDNLLLGTIRLVNNPGLVAGTAVQYGKLVFVLLQVAEFDDADNNWLLAALLPDFYYCLGELHGDNEDDVTFQLVNYVKNVIKYCSS
jgi:hypothetical protein